MALKIAKVGLPNDENIISRNKFVIDTIFPVAIKPTEMENSYLLLFTAHQNCDNSYMYFQIMINVDDSTSSDFVNSHYLFLKNISSSIENEKAYKESISNLKNDNLYGTDFDLKQDEEYENYYRCTGVRGIDFTHASIVDIYVPKDNYIKIKLYLDKITLYPDRKYIHELVFIDRKYNNMEFISIGNIYYDGTCQIDVANLSHYTLYDKDRHRRYCINYLSPIDKKYFYNMLKKPVDFKLYESLYKDSVIVNDIIVEEDFVYLLYEGRSVIDGSLKSMKVLKLARELVNKTNFIDYNKNIYIKKER